jgi:hypothetical protein
MMLTVSEKHEAASATATRLGRGADRCSGKCLGVGNVSVIVNVGDIDPVGLQIEHGKAEPGP